MRTGVVVTAALGLALLLTIDGSLSGQIRSVSERDLALVSGTIYSSSKEDPIPDCVVLIENGKIAAAGRRASVRIPPRGGLLRFHRLRGGLFKQRGSSPITPETRTIADPLE
jgi:hypothetical protein